jgi:hypothetical protein
VQQKISAGSGRAALMVNEKDRSDADKIGELYRWVYSREPDSDELKVATAHLEKMGEANKKSAYEDIIWALINTKEFLFNH